MQEQKSSESGKNTWTYTLADEFDNLSTVERDTPPTIVEWEYTCRGESFKAETKEAAETLMVKYFESCTPYRGFIQIAKYLGYGIFPIDTDGNRYVWCGNLPQGPFQGEGFD